jgi:YHS domain-containing protein
MPLDPVCGQPVRRRGNRQRAEYADRTYLFCSPTCLQRFDAQPDLFTAGPGEGNLTNRGRDLRPTANPGAGPRATLTNQESDAGPG